MRATLDAWQANADLVFTPHLLPVFRGILSTITVPLNAPLADPLAPWKEAFGAEPFIEVATATPSLKDVQNRNVVRISAVPLANTRMPMLLVTVGDRQSHEGRGGPGASEREPDARSRRDRGSAGMTRVIKIGGRPQSDASLPGALATASRMNGGVVLVHGGGDEVSLLQSTLGGSTKFVNGRRVTMERDIDIVRMALSGSANKRLVAALVDQGLNAGVGLSVRRRVADRGDADGSRTARLRRRAVADQHGVREASIEWRICPCDLAGES